MTIVLLILLNILCLLLLVNIHPNITSIGSKKALPKLSIAALLISILLPDKSTVFIFKSLSFWEDTAKIILLEFYKYAGKDTPEWIDYIMEEDVSGQADEESELEIRAFFINIINDAYNKFVRTLPLEKQNDTIAKAIQRSTQ
jgi:hypothetical protein